MIVYHCSLSNIDDFIFSNKGVHFGGKQSAIEAALRKTVTGNEKLYLHKCRIETNLFYDCEDKGNHEEWIKLIEEALEDGFSVIRYTNRYELDFEPSYIVLNNKNVEILSVSIITAKKAEEQILELLY